MSLEKNDLLIRHVTKNDFELLWSWVNDPIVRKNSFNSEPIPFSTHIEWCKRKIKDPLCTMYLFYTLDNIPISHVRFEQDRKNSAIISITVSPSQRGRGFGTKSIRQACERFLKVTSVNDINAYIKADNKASIRAFKKAGFSFIEEIIYKTHPTILMTYRRNEHG